MYVKFEKGKKYTRKQLKDQEISDSLAGFSDAGYILNQNELVVDIDSLPHNVIKSMIDTFSLKTKTVWTDRGVHLYFQKPMGFRRANGITALGFPVEYKHSGNTYALTIKRNGVERQVENEGVLKPIPNYLLPMTCKNSKSLIGLEEGDERNNTLYAHKAKISKLGNTKKILKFINQNIFATPLDENELETLIRDESFDQDQDGENYVADTFMKNHKVVKHQGILYFMHNNTYCNDTDELKALVYSYCTGQKTRYVDEVIKQMLYRCPKIPDYDEFKIKLNNGYLFAGEFYEYNFNGFTPYSIDISYKPDAKPVEAIDEYLKLLSNNDDNYRDFILEIIATCLITNPEFKRHLAKFFIFVGDGGNGKGTLLEIITKILGCDNVGANSIEELGIPSYVATLVGKLANLGDDIIDEPINKKEMKVLKNLSTGDRIQIKRLYENPISVSLQPTLIFTSNHILKSWDKDYSYKRRVVWCPIYNKPDPPKPNFIESVTTKEGLEYWLKLIVDAYRRLYESGEYTPSETIEEFNEEYHRGNNNTIVFVESLTDDEIDGAKIVELLEDYQTWCLCNGEEPLGKKQLYATIKARGFKPTELRRKAVNNGRTYRAWRKIQVC